MNNSIRIRTDVGGGDKYINFELKNEFDFIEILSLKLRQEDLYRLFCSDYGVVVGRVIANSGFGVPNARVSIFIPINDDDKDNTLISGLYPYENISDKDSKGVRYNLLPKKSQFDCHSPVGNLPTKREILDNDVMLDIYEKYYKFTTRTNEAGDFMIFGIPTGTWKLNVDVDLSDIGVISQKPYDFIRQGQNKKRFEHNNKFKKSNNLNDLPQIHHTETSIDVLPFWGDADNCQVGINRIDVEISHRIEPQAFFIGSIFGDNEKNSVNKRCGVRKDLGNLCETISSEGTIEIIRKTNDGLIEQFLVEGGRVIDENGSWAYQIPMNLDYYVTDEFGNLIPTEDSSKGIPTRARVRFRVGMEINGEEGRLRRRAKYLVPNNPDNGPANYDFDELTPDSEFRDLYWNKIYTVKNFIPRFQPVCYDNRCGTVRRFVGVKDVDGCGDHTPFPYNRLDSNGNIIYSIICLLLVIFVDAIAIINRVVLRTLNGVLKLFKTLQWFIVKIACFAKHPGIGQRNERGACRCYSYKEIFETCSGGDIQESTCNDCAEDYGNPENIDDEEPCNEGCEGCQDHCRQAPSIIPISVPYITLKCDDVTYMPWFVTDDHKTCTDLTDPRDRDFCIATGTGTGTTSTSTGEYITCQQVSLARALNVFKFDFYNDWVNGTLFAFLFKQKIKKKGEGKNKFCDYDCNEFDNPTDNDNNLNADNNCKQNHIVDTCQSISDSLYVVNPLGRLKLSDSYSKMVVKEGVIKLYKDEYYYAATTHQGYPLFKTDIVLLGSISSCDVHGIPLIFNQLSNTTYQLPPSTDFYEDEITQSQVEVSGIDNLLFNINCAGISTEEKHCWNIRKICEIGVGLDELREDDNTYPDEIIGNNDIENRFIRNAFTIMNENGIDDINAISTSYSSNILSYNTDYGSANPMYLTTSTGLQYSTFREFSGGNGSPRLPYGDSYYFYFGIQPGKTGLDKFYKEFVQGCVVENTEDLILDASTTPVTVFGESDGSITVTVLNGIELYSFLIIYPNTNSEQYNDENSPFTFNGLESGTYQIVVQDSTGLTGRISVYVGQPIPLSMTLDAVPVSEFGGNDGKIIVSNIFGGTPDYDVCIISTPDSILGPCINNISAGNTVEFTGLIGGNYALRLNDSSTSPQYYASINVPEPQQLTVISQILNHITCHGGNNGRISLNISGGIPPYSYSTVGSVDNVIYETLIIEGPSQTYYTTVTDSIGNTVSLNTILPDVPEIVISVDFQNPTCHNAADGFINVNVTGGAPPYLYEWFKNNVGYLTQQNLSHLYAEVDGTSYILVLTDSNGCVKFNETILHLPTELSLDVSVNGNSVTLTAIGGNTGTRTFSLIGSPPITFSTSSATLVLNGVASGGYNTKVVDSKGCVAYGGTITV